MRIPVAADVTAKQLTWSLKKDTVKMALATTGEVLLEGQLYAVVEPNDSSWQMEARPGGKVVVITLVKV